MAYSCSDQDKKSEQIISIQHLQSQFLGFVRSFHWDSLLEGLIVLAGI